MKITKYISIVILLVVLALSCTTSEIPEIAPIDKKVTYKADIKPIMSNNCLTCHGSVNPANGLTLETYEQVKTSSVSGTLLQRINDAANPMPQSGLLSADKRALIAKWAEDGYLKD